MIKPATFEFDVRVPSERAAGILGYTDMVRVVVESGDPGGVPGEFAEFIRKALREWHDGGVVVLVRDSTTGLNPTNVELLYMARNYARRVGCDFATCQAVDLCENVDDLLAVKRRASGPGSDKLVLYLEEILGA